METIKNYLESMFASMPNTPEVRKAKAELLQMMEDKYNELISEGTSENAAVGTVISEFGNLDELAESLSLTKEVEVARGMESEMPRRFISLDEAKSYLSNRNKKALQSSRHTALHHIGIICDNHGSPRNESIKRRRDDDNQHRTRNRFSGIFRICGSRMEVHRP